jgi:hypothetical protein
MVLVKCDKVTRNVLYIFFFTLLKNTQKKGAKSPFGIKNSWKYEKDLWLYLMQNEHPSQLAISTIF